MPGTFLQQIKTTKIISVYKKGDHLDCTNYHTISLLLSLEKQIVKLIHSIMNIYLENHKCFYKKQFGFRKKTLDRLCLDNYYKKDLKCVWQESIYLWIFFWFSKGFWYSKSENTFYKIRVPCYYGYPHDLIKSYLTNRKLNQHT